jgi:hypothetical protein
MAVTPVVLFAGRFKLGTRPRRTGSPPAMNTTGMIVLSPRTARVPNTASPTVTTSATPERTMQFRSANRTT